MTFNDGYRQGIRDQFRDSKPPADLSQRGYAYFLGYFKGREYMLRLRGDYRE